MSIKSAIPTQLQDQYHRDTDSDYAWLVLPTIVAYVGSIVNTQKNVVVVNIPDLLLA